MNKKIKTILQIVTFPFKVFELVCIGSFLLFIGFMVWISNMYDKIWSDKND